jgi:hypothetical protein
LEIGHLVQRPDFDLARPLTKNRLPGSNLLWHGTFNIKREESLPPCHQEAD